MFLCSGSVLCGFSDIEYSQMQLIFGVKFEIRGIFMQIQPPLMVSYSVTQKCKLKCKHCYSDSVDRAAPDELSTQEALRLVDDLSNWGIGLLVIDGGEPLCREVVA